VNYFEVEKCSEMFICAVVGSCSRFSTAKSGFNKKYPEHVFYIKKDFFIDISLIKWLLNLMLISI